MFGVFNYGVRNAYRMMSGVVMAFWLLSIVHCPLELRGFALWQCADVESSTASHHAEHSPGDDDSCCPIEDGKYLSKTPGNLVQPPLLMVAWILPCLANQTDEPVLTSPKYGSGFASLRPKPWLFVERTALPPRAPCLAS